MARQLASSPPVVGGFEAETDGDGHSGSNWRADVQSSQVEPRLFPKRGFALFGRGAGLQVYLGLL